MLIALMANKNFGFGTQIRRSPYFESTVKWGATGFSVYNHMYIPRDFGNPGFQNLSEYTYDYKQKTLLRPISQLIQSKVIFLFVFQNQNFY